VLKGTGKLYTEEGNKTDYNIGRGSKISVYKGNNFALKPAENRFLNVRIANLSVDGRVPELDIIKRSYDFWTNR